MFNEKEYQKNYYQKHKKEIRKRIKNNYPINGDKLAVGRTVKFGDFRFRITKIKDGVFTKTITFKNLDKK